MPVYNMNEVTLGVAINTMCATEHVQNMRCEHSMLNGSYTTVFTVRKQRYLNYYALHYAHNAGSRKITNLIAHKLCTIVTLLKRFASRALQIQCYSSFISSNFFLISVVV